MPSPAYQKRKTRISITSRYVICNFPISSAPKIKLRHGTATRSGWPHTHQHCNLWCTFDLQQFYLRISHIATVTAACKESHILAEVPVATWNYKYVSWKTKWKPVISIHWISCFCRDAFNEREGWLSMLIIWLKATTINNINIVILIMLLIIMLLFKKLRTIGYAFRNNRQIKYVSMLWVTK